MPHTPNTELVRPHVSTGRSTDLARELRLSYETIEAVDPKSSVRSTIAKQLNPLPHSLGAISNYDGASRIDPSLSPERYIHSLALSSALVDVVNRHSGVLSKLASPRRNQEPPSDGEIRRLKWALAPLVHEPSTLNLHLRVEGNPKQTVVSVLNKDRELVLQFSTPLTDSAVTRDRIGILHKPQYDATPRGIPGSIERECRLIFSKHAKTLVSILESSAAQVPKSARDEVKAEIASFFGLQGAASVAVHIQNARLPIHGLEGLKGEKGPAFLVTVHTADQSQELGQIVLVRNGDGSFRTEPSFIAHSNPATKDFSRRLPFVRALCQEDAPSSLDETLSSLLVDPSLRHINLVGAILAEDGVAIRSQNGAVSFEGAERCARISRSLTFQNLPATRDNIQKIDTLINQTLAANDDTPLFDGRSVLVGAHGETVKGSSGVMRFGTDNLLKAIQAQGASSHTMSRPIHNQQSIMSWATAWGEAILSLDANNVRKAEAALLRMVDSDGTKRLTSSSVVDRSKDEISFKVMSQSEEILALRVTIKSRDGVPKVAIHVSTNKYGLSPEEAKVSFLRKLRETPPGPNGFACFFDGHGSPDGLYFADGEPGNFSKNRDIRLTPGDIASALADRSRRFPNEPAPNILLASCNSGTFVQLLAQECLVRNVGMPNLAAVSEYGQYGYTEMKFTATAFYKALFTDGGTPKKEKLSVGSLSRIFRSTPQQGMMSNPIIIVPSKESGATKGKPLQISDGRRDAEHSLGQSFGTAV